MLKKLLISISLAFICSCSSNDSNEEPQQPSSSSVAETSSSSSLVQSSSSETLSSSSSGEPNSSSSTEQSSSSETQSSSSDGTPTSGTFTDPRDSQTYKWVKIGSQNWMAENLNFQTINSMCHGYDNDPANCEKYGKLYDWDAAMNACPVGWRLPSKKDFEELVQTAGGKNVAGKKLKTTAEWCYYDDCGNGTDEFGFSALPSSYAAGPIFGLIGTGGNWWGATSDEVGWAYHLVIDQASDGAYITSALGKKFERSFSIRCVEGENIDVSQEHFNSNITYSSFTDSRDQKTYRTVTIGGKKWMAENLNYATTNSWCYKNGYCTEYGRLYDWISVQEACPSGWRLPTNEDWENLLQAVGGWSVAGGKLKSKIGWVDKNAVEIGTPGNGTDDFGFSALPGAWIDGKYYSSEIGAYATWWSATTYSNLNISASNETAVLGYSSIEDGRSIRCVED